MPFQVFRRHRRKMVGLLAILAMFAFVLADSLPRLFNDYATPVGGTDRIVVTLDGRGVRRSEMERLRLQRGRANYVLSQLALRIGEQPVAPYFDGQTFGPTDDRAIVDALILERKADGLGLPNSADLARNWIFEQARMRHELFRSMSPTLTPFDPVDLAFQLQIAFNQAFGRELTEAAFLGDVASQVRILETLELLSQSMVTPLDAFQVYSDRQVEVEARYASFAAEDFLDRVPEPSEEGLRSFFDEHADRLPDPSAGTIGFRVPGRAKVEYLVLGIDAIDAVREQIRSEPLAEEVRAADGFEDDVLEAYVEELQRREGASFSRPLPVNPFTDPADERGVALSFPIEFERQYVDQQVEQLVQERMRDRIEDLFEPVKQAMNDFGYGIEGDLDAVRTGLEPAVDRDALPALDGEFFAGEAGSRLAGVLGPAARKDEGVTFVRIGLTEALADPDAFQELLAPDGIPQAWRDYLTLARLEWADAPYSLLRSVHRLTQAVEGTDRPDLIDPSDSGRFAQVVFDDDDPLFDPREFTDPDGRRYLAWKTIDLPEASRSFRDTPRELIASLRRRDRARELARQAAEALADRVREAAGEEGGPAATLDRIAAEDGLTVRGTGARRRIESVATLAPIDAGEDLQDALFRLSDEGEDAAIVAPDRRRETFYVFALSRRGDGSFGGSLASQGSGIDYTNALTSLQFFRSDADGEAVRSRVEAVMNYLRRQAGLPADWSPPSPERG